MLDEVRSYGVPLYYYNITVIEQHENGTLEFYWIGETWNVGIYTCIASNKYGSHIMHKYICTGQCTLSFDMATYEVTLTRL